MKRLILSTCVAALLGAPGSARAEMRSVVELFTSQGCSSCPPADKILGQIARAPDVLALSFPVDYWDYIGWKDTFAKPAYTARQKAYAGTRGDGAVYTPQAVVDGQKHVVGSELESIKSAMASEHGKNGALSVPVQLADTSVHVGPAKGAGTVWLLKVTKSREVAIGRGENAGHTVIYTNIVRNVVRLGDWNGLAANFDIPARLADEDMDGYAVLVQAGTAAKPGVILGAAKSEGL